MKILSLLFPLLTLISGVRVSAQTLNLGRELDIKMDSVASASLQYSYDADMFWKISFQSTLTAQDLQGLPEKLAWGLYDPDSRRYVSVIQNFYGDQLTSLFQGEIGEEESLREFLPRLKSLLLVIQDSQTAEPQFFLPIKKICDQRTAFILDLTRPGAPACEISPEDLPSHQHFCELLSAQLLLNVKNRLLGCGAAAKVYSEKSCGSLNCND